MPIQAFIITFGSLISFLGFPIIGVIALILAFPRIPLEGLKVIPSKKVLAKRWKAMDTYTEKHTPDDRAVCFYWKDGKPAMRDQL